MFQFHLKEDIRKEKKILNNKMLFYFNQSPQIEKGWEKLINFLFTDKDTIKDIMFATLDAAVYEGNIHSPYKENTTEKQKDLDRRIKDIIKKIKHAKNPIETRNRILEHNEDQDYITCMITHFDVWGLFFPKTIQSLEEKKHNPKYIFEQEWSSMADLFKEKENIWHWINYTDSRTNPEIYLKERIPKIIEKKIKEFLNNPYIYQQNIDEKSRLFFVKTFIDDMSHQWNQQQHIETKNIDTLKKIIIAFISKVGSCSIGFFSTGLEETQVHLLTSHWINHNPKAIEIKDLLNELNKERKNLVDFITLFRQERMDTCFKSIRDSLVEQSAEKEKALKRQKEAHVHSDIQERMHNHWGTDTNDKKWDCLSKIEKKIIDCTTLQFIHKEYNMESFIKWLLQKGVFLSEADMDINEMKSVLKHSHNFKKYAQEKFGIDPETVLKKTENPNAIREWYWNTSETKKHRIKWANEILEHIKRENISSLALKK